MSARRRHLRYHGAIVQQAGNNQVVYTVPSYPVQNNFPNSRHVSASTVIVEQRLNQHYSQNQPPPSYGSVQQQRY